METQVQTNINIFILLIILTVTSIGGIFISLVERYYKLAMCIGLLIFSIYISFFTIANMSKDTFSDKIIPLQLSTLSVDGKLERNRQDLVYLDQQGNERTINLNQRFGRIFDNQQKFRVVIYRDGWYGIWYWQFNDKITPVE